MYWDQHQRCLELKPITILPRSRSCRLWKKNKHRHISQALWNNPRIGRKSGHMGSISYWRLYLWSHIFPMSERWYLKRAGFATVREFFLTDEPRSFVKVVTINIPNQNTQMKIPNIIKNIKSKRREFRNTPLTKNHLEAKNHNQQH